MFLPPFVTAVTTRLLPVRDYASCRWTWTIATRGIGGSCTIPRIPPLAFCGFNESSKRPNQPKKRYSANSPALNFLRANFYSRYIFWAIFHPEAAIAGKSGAANLTRSSTDLNRLCPPSSTVTLITKSTKYFTTRRTERARLTWPLWPAVCLLVDGETRAIAFTRSMVNGQTALLYQSFYVLYLCYVII